VIAELARQAANFEIPFLSSKRFLWIDARYVPPAESQARLTALLSHLLQHENVVVCIEGIRSLLNTSQGDNGKQVLLSALAASDLRVIGLMSDRDYEDVFTDDQLLLESFDRVRVQEPDVPTAESLLFHYRDGLQHEFGVGISDAAVKRAVVLSSNYILNECLPGKALKILHRACDDLLYERTQHGVDQAEVDVDDVVRIVSELSGVPHNTLLGIADECDYQASLSEFIVGQSDAVSAAAMELGLIKAGLTDASKPASVMLFVGMTGTGKTELAKTLARFYSTTKRLRMYTMANFVEPHSVSGIIGVPAGYVGHESGGRLINELNADPYGVFLLDEIDKAHPDVLQPLLNLFDEGWVRDQRGVVARANHSIFIMTTNVGQRMIADMEASNHSVEEITEKVKDALSSIRHTKANRPVFSPEFLARIKRTVVFRPLTAEAMQKICRMATDSMAAVWAEQRDKTFVITDEVIDYVSKKSHQLNERSKGKEGGRIVHKLLSKLVDAEVQQAIANRVEEYQTCREVHVDLVPQSAEEMDSNTTPHLSVRFTQ
jgi:ATP-dependent Clp protease ATP-binding subunit ClpA